MSVSRDELVEKLEEMRSLEEGWDDYSAPTIDESCLARAETFIRGLPDEMLKRVNVWPDCDGSVEVHFRSQVNQVTAVVSFNNDEDALPDGRPHTLLVDVRHDSEKTVDGYHVSGGKALELIRRKFDAAEEEES